MSDERRVDPELGGTRQGRGLDQGGPCFASFEVGESAAMCLALRGPPRGAPSRSAPGPGAPGRWSWILERHMLTQWTRTAILPHSVRKKPLATIVQNPQNEHKFAVVGCGSMGLLIACELLRRGCCICMGQQSILAPVCLELHESDAYASPGSRN